MGRFLKKEDTKIYAYTDWNDQVDQRKVDGGKKIFYRNKIL